MVRNVSGSRPSDAPKVARKIPTTEKDSASPAPSANAPQRCALTAVASSTGTSGRTQGDNVDKAPANRPSPKVIVQRRLGNRLLQERVQAIPLRIAGRARNFLSTSKYHDRALLSDAEGS